MHDSLRKIPKKLAVALGVPTTRYIDKSTLAIYKYNDSPRDRARGAHGFWNEGISRKIISEKISELNIDLK